MEKFGYPNFVTDVLRQCKTNPNRVAVIDFDDRKSTYSDFYDIIKRTSGYIKSRRIAPKSFIVINLPNCMEYLAIEYGCWLSGCTIVPVNPSYPKARTDYIASHCEAPLVIGPDQLEDIRKAEPIECCEANAPIAALFYTSGSTGTPKAVIHTFESLSHIDSMREYAEVFPDDCYATGAPFSFIAWIFTVSALRVGACLRLIPHETMLDIRKLQTLFDKEEITCTFINPPSTLQRLNLKNNKMLRFILTGSERVSGIKSESNYKIINVYGQTEAAATALYYVVDKEYANTPIGKPTSDLDMKIMDDGELCLRGSLTPGYYKDPARSAALWTDGWLHTGDIVRMLPDGNVEYINRKDWMVKINGQRVETGEIAAVIKEVSGVSDVVVKGFTAPDGHQYVVAYYIASENVNATIVKEYISGKLAPYMIPAFFVKMPAFPTIVNGKVDVKSLQSPMETGEKVEARDIVKPKTSIEKILCKGFETALGLSPVSIEDDFFDLGGDSIRVMQLQVACPQLDLSSSLIYTHRSVRAIAAAISTEKKASAKSSVSCPLSKTQSGIFVECMSRRGQVVYNNPMLFKIENPVDVKRLALACEKAVSAHPNVFASIKIDDNGVPMQIKNSTEGFEVNVEHVSDIEFDGIRTRLVQPFDILKDRLFRMRLFKAESAVWLFTDFHHIIFDGTSNTILLADIEKAFDGEEVEPETYTGFDLACDEQAQRDTTFFNDCMKWNLDTFCSAERTSLPDPDKFKDTVTYGKFETPTGISALAFAKTAERLGVTENVLATGAFGYMLGACSHTRNAAFATIYNGRKSLKTARTMSMIVKTLPVYCCWDMTSKTGDYFKAVKEQIVGAMAHDLFSFAEICSKTAYDSRVLFSYQDELLERKSLCGSNCEMISLLENATGEPFTVELYKNGGTLMVGTEYRSNMYSESYLKQYISCFISILTSLLLAEKNTLTSDWKLVSDPEQRSVIAMGWGRKLDYDKQLTFVKMFRKCVATYPAAGAVVDENGTVTYGELDTLSDKLASQLIREGVEVEDFVALMLPRLCIFPLSYIACFKCGAAYVPIDYEYPIERIQYMIEDSEAKVLLTTREIYERKSAEGILNVPKVIFVDEIDDDIDVIEGLDKARPEGLAYMIYTSGTTGRPKGVMIEHRALNNLVNWYADAEYFGPGSRIAEHASFSFDGSVPDLMTPLCFGGELHILPSGIRKDLAAMYRYFSENRIDGGILTTQLGLTMLRMYDLKLKFLMFGGEKMVGKFNTSIHLYNGYGPTEFTVASSTYLVNPDNIPDNIPIGRPVPNTLSAIVDSCGRLLPKGITGELVLVGCQISRGYWHRPEITSERFADCTFLPGQKMYHTGDLARWNEEGELLFMGRIDTQVKLRGFRIELGEIESNLMKYPGVKTAVVAVKEISGLQHLCAYYCSDEELDKEAIRTFLASSLTDYMVPTSYIRMDTMPMTPNGKVDIRRLPVPEIKAEEIVKPETELEEKLFAIVSEFLKNEDFGVMTNLISMGLTSLGAITISLQIQRKTSFNLPSSKILESPTIRKWAHFLDSNSTVEESLSCYPKQKIYPLTENQTGIYIDWEQHKDSTQYNVPMLFHFTDIEAEKIVASVKAFVNAHPYLKMHLQTVDGQVIQVRDDDASVHVAFEVLQTEPTKNFFQQQMRHFNLFDGPLYSFSVYSFENSVWLLSDIHHIVFDGGSEALFAREIVDFCNGIEPSPEHFSAFDYSLYYQEWKQSDDFIKSEHYFTSLLEGTVAATLPSSASGEVIGSDSFSVSVDRPQLKAICRAAGVTENALFLTAVTQVLHRYTREQNIDILTVSNGRSLRALEHTCGMFVQTLPVVSSMGQRTVGESLSSMHNQIISTIANDKYPYTAIVEKTGLRASVLLAYQGDVLGGQLSVGDHQVEMSGLDLDTAKMPLSININPSEASTQLVFEYDKAAYNESDVISFATAVKNFIDNMASSSLDVEMGSVSCVSAEEKDSLIHLGTGPEMTVEEGTLVDLVSKNAEAFPDDPAVTDAELTITYAKLDKSSDLLAGLLLSAGLKKEDFVSLMLPRNHSFVVSYLAVHKSGGAYVPMDDEYPIERLQYMIEDSRSRFLITTHELLSHISKEGDIRIDNIIFYDDIDFSKASSAVRVNHSIPDGLAYMIYTSGTTGRPKGVMIEHRALMNMMAWNSNLEGIVRGTPVAEHASFSFDASVLDLTTSIAYGGHLHILSESCRKDPEMIYRYLLDKKIEITTASTQLGMMLLSSYNLPIRMIIMGGEKLTGKYDGTVTIVNGYGPTEFTVCSSYHIVDPVSESNNIPIGKAVPNTISAIVDPYGRLMPRGVPGELVLIGAQIARGYWNREDITAQRFVDCPFAPGAKMYHTGDLARWSDKGELLFMGRIDTQVKLRGFRIELGEIENTMSSFKDVTAAVAQVKEIGGVQHLCGYFTASTKISTDDLKAHLSASLTSYMVPDAFVQLDAMPLTPNGKVDIKRLPLPELSVPAASSTFEAPQGEVEQVIADVFQKVLGMSSPMDRNSSFFLSGGTSLLVMKVIVRLSEKNYKLTYKDVFQYPTPRTLAAFLSGFEAGYATNSASVGVVSNEIHEETKNFAIGEDGYDYTTINKRLATNCISEIDIDHLDVNPIGDVLLLGSTGYLGIHVLKTLLTETDSKVYCLIRAKNDTTCANRLKVRLMYLFENKYEELFDNRLFVIEGDLTDANVMDKLLTVKVDTVINCAANVKHFAAGYEIEKINLNGTLTLINYCLVTGSRLIHASTHSISGQNVSSEPHIMTEDELYFGQKMMTKYQTSKFQAERAILEASAKSGLKAKIMRLGNLMPRFSDGEFQINIENNGFMSRMRAYYLIGCIPYQHLRTPLEFSPIDETAHAILTLARTPDKFTVFHPFNNHTIFIDDVVAAMRKCGLKIDVTDNAHFNVMLEKSLANDHLNPYLTALMAYGSHNNYVMNQTSIDFTVTVLNAMDWRWELTDARYLTVAFNKMISLLYFDKCMLHITAVQ